MRLNKQTSHAIRILIDCARAGDGLIKVADIALRNDLTLQNALKIAHMLMRNRFIIAQRGRGGGIRLAREPRDILIGDIVRALEATAPAASAVPMAGVLDDAFDAFLAVLDQHTLADFLRDDATLAKARRKSGGPKPGRDKSGRPARRRVAVDSAGRRAARPAAAPVR